MAASGNLNGGPKRAAFGDVSNTSRVLVDISHKNLGKDRVPISNHRQGSIPDKENVPFSTNVSFLKPAQRPSTYTSKQLPPATSFSNTGIQTSNKPFTHNDEQKLPLFIESGISKKATVNCADRADTKLGAKFEVPVPVHQVADMETQPVKNPRQYKSQPQLRTEQPVVLRRTQSRHFGKTDEFDIHDDNATEASYEDALENLSEVTEPTTQPYEGHGVSSDATESDDKPVITGASVRASTELPPRPTIPEPEEYWDDDEEEEFYDEQGYTTAHSYRSHGDNTTGGPTTVLAPKVTARVQQELERAKAIVESNITEDEIEEEAWDVSMVTEYGEEIFQYMRSLEVSDAPLAPIMASTRLLSLPLPLCPIAVFLSNLQ